MRLPLLALLLSPAGLGAQQPEPPARPNILFVMADDHATQAISCYGSRINQTPGLDRLAREGMRFAHCLVTNAICAPARAAILTGQYSHRNGQRSNGEKFDGSQPHVAKLLQAAGYETALIGKWHLQSEPTGFDYWQILPGQGGYLDPVVLEGGKRRVHEGYVTDVLTDLAIAWLRGRTEPERPFFLMLHHKAPHREWTPAARHAALFADADVPEPATLFDDGEGRASGFRSSEMSIAAHLTNTDVKGEPPPELTGDARTRWYYQRYIKDYLRCVAAVDENMQRLLAYLDESGLSARTVLFYTSDQGFFLGDHGFYDKRFMYEEVLRTPLLVRWPGTVAPGTVNEDLAANIDLAPTFLEIAGTQIPDWMQGRSLLPLLAGRTPADWRRSFYYHYYEFPGEHAVPRHVGVRTLQHKLIWYYQLDEWELFDLGADPHELRNLYGDPEQQQLTAELRAELRRLQRELGDETVQRR